MKTRTTDIRLRARRRFLEALTSRLQVNSSFITPAYEDVFYYLWKERRLPVNVDPLDSKLKDPIEREQLARVFEQGLGATVGYFLPLRRIPSKSGTPRWTSQPWFVRPEHLFLIPGDSPMGYRLPLESLPWTKPEDVPWSYEPDPFQKRDKLPGKPQRRPDLFTAAAVHRRTGTAARQTPKTERRRVFEMDLASRDLHSAARRKAVRLHAAGGVSGGLPGPGRGHRRHRGASSDAGDDRRLHAALRSAYFGAQGHAGPGRHRSERAARRVLGRTGGKHDRALRTGAPVPSGHRKIHDRRAALRNRRRKSCGDRRRHSGRQRLPAPSRSVAKPGRLLAKSSVAVVSVLRSVHRSHQPASARGRSAHRFALRTGDRLQPDPGCGHAQHPAVDWSIACSAIC